MTTIKKAIIAIMSLVIIAFITLPTILHKAAMLSLTPPVKIPERPLVFLDRN